MQANDERQQLVTKKDVSHKWLLFDITTIMFFGTLCSSVPAAFFAREYLTKGGNYSAAGVILQTHPVMLALTAWMFGNIIPQFGYKSVAIFGVLLEGAAQIGFALTSYIENITIYTILSVFMRVLTGVGNSAAKTTVFAIAATEFGDDSTFMLGLLQSFGGFSYLIGPSIGASLFEIQNTMLLPLLIPGILYLMSVLRFAICYTQVTHKESQDVVKISSALKLMFNLSLIGPTLVQMCVRGSNGYRSAYLTVYMEELGLSIVDSGILQSVSAFLFMIGSIVCGRLIPKFRDMVTITMVIGCALWATTWLSTTITNKKLEWLIFSGFCLNGFLRGVVMVCIYQFSFDFVRTINIDMTVNERISCLVGAWTSAGNLGRFIFAVVGGEAIEITGSAAKTNIGFVILGYVVTIATLCIHLTQYLKIKMEK